MRTTRLARLVGGDGGTRARPVGCTHWAYWGLGTSTVRLKGLPSGRAGGGAGRGVDTGGARLDQGGWGEFASARVMPAAIAVPRQIAHAETEPFGERRCLGVLRSFRTVPTGECPTSRIISRLPPACPISSSRYSAMPASTRVRRLVWVAAQISVEIGGRVGNQALSDVCRGMTVGQRPCRSEQGAKQFTSLRAGGRE